MSNDSKVFDMEQTVRGPNIMLSYQCGTETITIKSQQNYCAMEAGNVTGEMTSQHDVLITVIIDE